MSVTRPAVSFSRTVLRSSSRSAFRRNSDLSASGSSRAAIGSSDRFSWLTNTRGRRHLHSGATRSAAAVAAQSTQEEASSSSNPALSFPCLDRHEARQADLTSRSQTATSGPEPSYTSGEHLKFRSDEPLLLDWGGTLPSFDIAYETWGTLNADKSNAILLHTGLSASSHAHSTESNPRPGWWEKFIGPNAPLNTDKHFIICTNVIGSCYGSTGPGSIDPANGKRYGTRFPILTMEDMVRAQFRLLDHLGIPKLYASVGSSMGGMQSLAAGVLFPERVGRIASTSGAARSHPYSIALRHTQRQVLMTDPNWNRGFYYESGIPPHAGMKLARQIATVTYRSGPEWEKRFGRRRADPSKPPALCPDYLIETYLDHAGEKWCLEYDANSLLYVSKAMDLFDLGEEHQRMMTERRAKRAQEVQQGINEEQSALCSLTLPDKPYEERNTQEGARESDAGKTKQQRQEENNAAAGKGLGVSHQPPADLVQGMRNLKDIPTLVMGVTSDILFPAWQQREIAETLRAVGNKSVSHVELDEEESLFGHDTFLLDLENIGGNLKRFLEK